MNASIFFIITPAAQQMKKNSYYAEKKVAVFKQLSLVLERSYSSLQAGKLTSSVRRPLVPVACSCDG
jgi:hypothetical protein